MSTKNGLLEVIPERLHEQLYAELKEKFGDKAGNEIELDVTEKKEKVIKEIKSWAESYNESIKKQNDLKHG